ncbi:restriction endonuclease subunit S [Helicobacter pylori]|uniref:restriction endonuclease subunit S n=1 Tax=Helicobacter pylori TaxID=210 RepID=UPI0029293CAB|nr:restriction endonuclease subunit S [Helicobacter pylori]MDU9765664.1 restriction endonuclease subunit S [Helicobacter pylori]
MSKTLQDYATLINDTIQSNEINHYITTANMCQNLGGIDTFKNINIPQGKVRSFQKDDVLLSNIDPWHRQVYMAKQKGGCSSDVLVFRANHIDSATLFAILSSQSFINYVCLGSIGSKRKRGDKVHMMNFKIPTINFTIAKIFNSIQNKIENNHKINELLHKILELLYEQYFVRFDFLDENNKPYQTSGGKMKFSKELNRLIPNDFEVKTLGELVDIFSGYSFQSNTYSNNKNDYILITNKNVQHSLVDLSITTNLLFLPKKLPKYCLLEPTNILITLTGHIGRCALVFSKNCILNQRVGVVLPKEKELNPFYYSLIRNPLFSAILQRNAIGSSQQNLSPIDTLKIQIPFNHKIIKQYSKTCENIIKLLVSNMQSTQTLTAIRDFLLPLLLKQQVKPK